MKILFLSVFITFSLQLSLQTEADFVMTGHNQHLPFRICSIATGTDLVRFDREVSCASYGSNIKTTEGILIIYKTNILYYKPVKKPCSYVTEKLLKISTMDRVILNKYLVL